MSTLSRSNPFGFLFGRNLTALIRGIRERKNPEEREQFLREVLVECREEVRSPDFDVKTTAVLKLANLEMLGFDISWVGFHVIEVMASNQFQQKRIGYIAAMQSFRGDSELLMLVTNLLKMDLVNQNVATVGIALSGLATIVTPSLAADVSDDIMRMLTHSKPRIRQKAVLALYKVVLQYPEIFETAKLRIAELLDNALESDMDPDNQSVVAAAVSVIGELAYNSPATQFLDLTPRLFSIFVSSQHNWTLIKLLKIFQLLTREEPKLIPKLLPEVNKLLKSTDSVSIMYECLNCIIRGQMVEVEDYELGCDLATRIFSLIEKNSDANIMFVATGLLSKLAETNSQFLPIQETTQLLTTVHQDPVTMHQVLKLAKAMVNDDNIFEIITSFVAQFKQLPIDSPKKIEIAQAVSDIGSVKNYEFIPDFEWFLSIISSLWSSVFNTSLSKRVLDIVIRVKDDEVRQAACKASREWLETHNTNPQSSKPNMSNSLPFADVEAEFTNSLWWIIGEFSNDISFQVCEQHKGTPPMLTAIAKIVSKNQSLLNDAIEFFTPLSFSMEFEVQERACEFLEVFKLAKSSPNQQDALLSIGLGQLFSSYDIFPVAKNSQRQISVPEGLDLDTPVLVDYGESDEFDENVNHDSESEEEEDVEETIEEYNPPVQSDIVDTSTITPEVELNRNLFDLSKKVPLEELKLSEIPAIKPMKKKVQIIQDEMVAPAPLGEKPQPVTNTSPPPPAPQETGETDEPVIVKHKKSIK